jgi:Kef-type K+ transport system membrane component KefB
VNEYLIQTVEESAAQVLFATLLLFLFAISLAAVLFGVLLVRAIFRWLTRHSWNDVIVSTERKALRGK